MEQSEAKTPRKYPGSANEFSDLQPAADAPFPPPSEGKGRNPTKDLGTNITVHPDEQGNGSFPFLQGGTNNRGEKRSRTGKIQPARRSQ